MTRLPKETINDYQSVDAIFVEMHKAYEKQKVPMDDDQARWSVSIMTANEYEINRMYDDFKKQSWQFAGFFKRCEIFPIKYDKQLLVWLLAMNAEFGIGGMILVAYYVQWAAYRLLKFKWAADGGKDDMWRTEIDLNFVCEEIFPFGIFDKKTVHEFWDKQKVNAKPDNLIDHPTACTSFMPIERKEPINSNDHVF